MSMNKHYYVIAGYDLTSAETEKYRDWKWTDEGEQFLCHQSKGHIQLFDDPEGDRHLYLGFILAAGDEYYFETTTFNPWHITDLKRDVDEKANTLIKYGVVDEGKSKYIKFQLIAFEECM